MSPLLQRNIAYGADPRQQLDVYRPRLASTPATTMIFWHGGSWRSGDKAWYFFMGRALSRLGYTVVIPNYRLSPTASFVEMMADAAAATRCVHKELKPARLVVVGHSSGAHMAAILSLDPRHLQAVGLNLRAIHGFIGLAGPYDFDHSAGPQPALSVRRPQNWQPIDMVAPGILPMLLIHGRRDRVVAPSNSRNLVAAATAAGGQAKLVELPHLGHMSLLLPFIVPAFWPNLSRQLVEFTADLPTSP